MNKLQGKLRLKIPTDTWVTASWDDYVNATANSDYQKAKCYYYSGQLRIEMPPVGANHADDNNIVAVLISLFGVIRNLPIRGFTNCSYRRVGIKECQPDISYYIADRVQFSPQGSSIVDLDLTHPPDLAIEVADSSWADDIGKKRLLYEELGIAEYWVVDVRNTRILAFTIANNGSYRIDRSQVLPELSIVLLEQALQRSRQTDNSQVGNWFITQIQDSALILPNLGFKAD